MNDDARLSTDKAEVPSQAELKKHIANATSREIGWIGRVIGNNKHAPFNIAAVVLVVTLFLVGALYFFPPSGFDRKTELAPLLSILTLALGYIFGKRT